MGTFDRFGQQFRRSFFYNVVHIFHSSAGHKLLPTMKQHQLSTVKRLTKPILFGTLVVGLATAFLNRHLFFEDVAEIRAQERARNQAKLLEVMEGRQRQMEELMEKKGGFK